MSVFFRSSRSPEVSGGRRAAENGNERRLLEVDSFLAVSSRFA
jgi:hypothetical protein